MRPNYVVYSGSVHGSNMFQTGTCQSVLAAKKAGLFQGESVSATTVPCRLTRNLVLFRLHRAKFVCPVIAWLATADGFPCACIVGGTLSYVMVRRIIRITDVVVRRDITNRKAYCRYQHMSCSKPHNPELIVSTPLAVSYEACGGAEHCIWTAVCSGAERGLQHRRVAIPDLRA